MGRWADIVGLLNPLKIISGDSVLYLGTGNRPSSYGFPNSVYLVMDKTSSADDATVVYRTNGNARAESGLAEDDDYHIKTISGTYGSEVFTDRVIVRGAGFVDAVNSILRVNSATGTPTLIVGNSDGTTAGAGVEVIYDQVNKQGTLNCIERGNTYRGMIVNCNGITYNFGGTTVANAGSFNQFGMTLKVPLSVTTTNSVASAAITDTGTSGANLKLAGNGATTPNKTIRAQGGKLEFVNSAYGAVVTTMDDAGNWSFSGALNVGSTLTASGGVTNGQSAASSIATLAIKGGGFSTSWGLYPRLNAGNYNNMAVSDTAAIIFSLQAQDTYKFFLGPWSSAAAGCGMLMDAAGQTTFKANGKGVVFSGTATSPFTDNASTCGAAAARWSVVYAATGTINTSDARDKTPVAPLSDAEVAAAKALAAEIGAYQFLDAITAKGDDKARHHIGLTVQRAIEIMQAHGLDPTRYGFICHDAWEATAEQLHTWPDQYETVEVEPAVTKEHPAIYEQVPVASRRRLFRRSPKHFHNRLVKAAWIETIKPAVTEERLVRAAGSEVTQPARAAGDRYSFRPDELLLFLARGFDARLTALEARA